MSSTKPRSSLSSNVGLRPVITCHVSVRCDVPSGTGGRRPMATRRPSRDLAGGTPNPDAFGEARDEKDHLDDVGVP